MKFLGASPSSWPVSWNAEDRRSMTPPARIDIYVQPRASKTAVVGMHDGAVKVRLAAPPVDGAANAALIEFVADRAGVAKYKVKIVSGLSSRRKVVEVEGMSNEQLAAALVQ